MYGMTNYENLFSGDITNFLVDVAGFKKLQLKFSVYYKYASDGSKIVVLSYVNDFVF